MLSFHLRPSHLLAVMLTLAACEKAKTEKPAGMSPSAAPPAGSTNTATAPANAAAAAGAHAPAGAPAAAAPGAQAEKITGKVLELLPAPPYAYLKMKAGNGEVWVAVPSADVAVGSEVTVIPQMPMDGYRSATLNRTFDRLYFGTLAGAAGAAAPGGATGAAQAHAAPAGHGTSAPAAAPGAPAEPVKVAKATGPNAHTVADIVAKRVQLKDKPVQVRGKVVKVNKGILGKNWLHIRDGSAEGNRGTDDIAVTTDQDAALGDVVLINGTVVTDRDFGSGYKYDVLIENAKITR